MSDGTEQTLEQLADAIIENLSESYDLVYVDYRDELSEEQAASIVSGAGEKFNESRWEWEDDNRYESCRYIIEEEMNVVLHTWESETDADLTYLAEAFPHSEQWDRVREEIEERDSSDWIRQLCRNTGRVLLRISALDEDAAYSFEEVKPRRVLKDLGIRATRWNVETIEQTLRECSPEYSVLLGYWIVGVDLEDIYNLYWDEDAELEIVNPYLYLGNPFSGSGFISERPVEGIVRVKRSDLRTDEDAFGYSVNDIYGGLRASDFEAEIRPARHTKANEGKPTCTP